MDGIKIHTKALDLSSKCYPAYVAGIAESDPKGLMETPLILGIYGDPLLRHPVQDDYHCSSFVLENDGKLLRIEESLRQEGTIASLARHFLIPFPGSFLQSTATTRGKIQKTNPFAISVTRLLETLEFLLSADGIHLCWCGVLKGELLPPNEWRKRTNQKGEELEIRPCDKVALENKPAMFASSEETQYGLEFFDALMDPEHPRLKNDPMSLRMEIKSADDGDPFVIDKCQLFWDFIPLMEPDSGFDEKYLEYFPNNKMFDKDSDIACINMHFRINDPRIHPSMGFKRLWLKSKECRNKKPVDSSKALEESSLTADEYNALRYAISPRNFVEAMSVITTNFSLAKNPKYESPDIEIWTTDPLLDICKVLSVFPIDDYPTIWSGDFNYVQYATTSDASINSIENIFKTRLQGKINDCLVQFAFDQDEAEDENMKMFVFPVPSRAVKIPSRRIHPNVLSNCLLPCYLTSSRHNKNIPFKPYRDEESLDYYRLMIPEITDIGLLELAQGIDMIQQSPRMKIDKSIAAEQENEGFLVDRIRFEKFDTMPNIDGIRFVMKKGKATPLQLIEGVRKIFVADFESEHPSAPTAQTAIYNWIKQERKLDRNFSLFPSVYDGELKFQFFANLSLSSNFKANMMKILDNLFNVYNGHKNILQVYTLLLLSTRMRYGDKLFALFTGPPQVSKSFCFKIVEDYFAITGTMQEEGSSSSQAINSGEKNPGRLVFHDDMGTTTSPIFTPGQKEVDSNAQVKAALSNSRTFRNTVYYHPVTKKRMNLLIETDNRGCEVGATNNDEHHMAKSVCTRTMITKCTKITRGLKTEDLDHKRRAYYPGAQANIVTLAFEKMMKSQQAFACLVLQAIRIGALPYDIEKNEHFAKTIHGRFKESLMHTLDQDSVNLSLRMEKGQLIPLMEGKMLERIYATCCSGIFPEESCLNPGAPFHLEKMLEEIHERSLLQFDMSDYVEAVSFFNSLLSQETTGSIIKGIKQKIFDRTTSDRDPQQAILLGETPINGRPKPPRNILDNIPRGSWINNPRLFYNEMKDFQTYVRDFNWIDLGAVFGLSFPNVSSVTSHSILKQFASVLKEVIPTTSYDYIAIFQDLQVLLDEHMTLYQELRVVDDGERKIIEEGTIPKNGRVIKITNQIAEGYKISSYFLLLNSQWIQEKAKKVKTNEKPILSPSSELFLASPVELALQRLSYEYCFEATYLLPGMTFDTPVPKPARIKEGNNNGITNEKPVFPMPHIAKTVRVFDARKNSAYKEELVKLGMRPKLYIGMNNNDGERLGYSGGESWGIEEDFDYYSTAIHLDFIQTNCLTLGCKGVHHDGSIEYTRSIEHAELGFQDYVARRAHMDNSPVALERKFSALRNNWADQNQCKLVDYVESSIRTELNMIVRSTSNFLNVSGAHNILQFSKKRTREEHPEEEMAESDEHSKAYQEFLEVKEDEHMEIKNEDTKKKKKKKLTAWDKVRLAQATVNAEKDEFIIPADYGEDDSEPSIEEENLPNDNDDDDESMHSEGRNYFVEEAEEENPNE